MSQLDLSQVLPEPEQAPEPAPKQDMPAIRLTFSPETYGLDIHVEGKTKMTFELMLGMLAAATERIRQDYQNERMRQMAMAAQQQMMNQAVASQVMNKHFH